MHKYRNFLNGLLNASLFSIVLALFTGSSAFAASPADEISRAVKVAGGADIKKAAPAEFVQGFRAVVIKAKQAEAPLYVSTAVGMRPDLAPQIAGAALKARPLDRRTCDGVDAIIKAAITAAPTARHAIAQAALAAQPAARDCILAAAGTSAAELQFAYTRRSSDGKQVIDGKDDKEVIEDKRVYEPGFPAPDIWDVGNIISINPGPGGVLVVSPSDPTDH
jgi:hypothetical protein